MRNDKQRESWFDRMSPKGRLALLVLTFVLLGVTLAFGQEVPKQETVAERVARQRVEARQNETPQERLIRLRAEQIELEEAIKKAKLEVATSDSPAMRKARAEFEKAEKKTAEVEEKARKAIANSGLQGCDPSTVQVHPDAVPYRSISSTVRIRVFNPESVPVNIEDSRHGLIVRGLCPGGSLTLFRARSLVDPDYLQFRFIARAMTPDGRMLMDESPSYTLSSHDWSSGRGRQEDNWTIQLQVVRQGVR